MFDLSSNILKNRSYSSNALVDEEKCLIVQLQR